MSEFLRKCNMQHHQQSLVNGGCVCGRLLRTYLRCSYDSVSRLLNLDARQLRKLGVKQGHATALMQAITAHKAEQEFARGRKHETADGVARNMHVAFKHYQRAMELGHKEAMVRVAAFYLRGYHVVKVDLASAKSLLEKAHAMQAKGAAALLSDAIGSDNDVLNQQIWESDPTDPLCRAQLLLLRGANESDFTDLAKVASAGDVEACFTLGKCLQNCNPPNRKKAAEFYESAARKGHATAQNHLAFLLDSEDAAIDSADHSGSVATQGGDEYAAAAEDWEDSMENTNTEESTAESTADEAEVAKEEDKEPTALFWYKLAAQQREPLALWNLHTADPDNADYWQHEAAKAGHATSQTNIGTQLLECDRSSAEGKVWLEMARDAGCAEAGTALFNAVNLNA